MLKFLFPLAIFVITSIYVRAQDHSGHTQVPQKTTTGIDPQPLLSQVNRLREALTYLGSSLPAEDEKMLEELKHKPLTKETITRIENILDPYCIAMVTINPESRVKVEEGAASPELAQGGWKSFLVKVVNEGGVTASLQAESVNAMLPQSTPSFGSRVNPQQVITPGQVANRFLDIQMYIGRPLRSNLSGLKLEYAVVQIYSKDAGKREAEIGFNVGPHSRDIGFRNNISVLFNISPSIKVKLEVKDENGDPAMASFIITDSIERNGGRMSNVYPLPSRRVPAFDEYPDFFFQRQIYRKDGEHVWLSPGKYSVTYSRGPEYIPQTQQLIIPSGKDSVSAAFQLKRWINLAKLGWYSGDHHVHASGCSHYSSPAEGVPPGDMWRQALGEDLNISAVLTWGPSWYHQKRYFTGKDDSLSDKNNIMRYDVEVSGFPSSHAGHLVLLGLKEDDYPGTTEIEQWPTWTLPVLNWAKSQGAITGYAHSGDGLAPLNYTYTIGGTVNETTPEWRTKMKKYTTDLPNYELPKMDGIGANEYVVTVTQNAVDFYSAGDTPLAWELNMWYHTLNCGFRTRLSGETDFPCATDERVGDARSYIKTKNIGDAVNYDTYLQAIKSGHSYVSDGSSHIMNFSVNGVEAGIGNSELAVAGMQKLNISADVAAYLPELQSQSAAILAKRPVTDKPYWRIERARIGKTRKIKVELIVNGVSVESKEITADGKINNVTFSYTAKKSSWITMRITPSAHSNPVFVLVDNKPIREKKSAEWCRQATEQCWKMKEPNIKTEEKKAAKAAYDRAVKYYEGIIKE